MKEEDNLYREWERRQREAPPPTPEAPAVEENQAYLELKAAMEVGFDLRCGLGQKFARMLKRDERAQADYHACPSTKAKQAHS
eukprot:2821030-Alexandrium_andersonii.AAC.1